MFTGLVQHLARVAAVSDSAAGRRLVVDIAAWSHRPTPGESIAVNGCCLTALDAPEQLGAAAFDVIAQTLRITTLGELKPGDRINLEHAVTPATMLGGHIVQGHIDGVGRVLLVSAGEAEHRLRLAPHDPQAMGLIVERGSIAVSGVSLTIAAVSSDAAAWFEIALIPTTLALTNLGSLRVGDAVNLEYDYLAKVVANLLRRARS